MNKGRNILLIMAALLTVSILSFFTLLERGNTNGVVDDVRFIVDSDSDGVREISLYFKETDKIEKLVATSDEEGVTFVFGDYEYKYRVSNDGLTIKAYDEDGNEVTSEEPFELYTKNLFKTMVVGKDKFLKFWQALIIFAIVAAGGAVIVFAEEIWHIIFKKGEDVIPKWSDMNGIKVAGGVVIGIGVVVFIILLII